ncbi:helix-turn-helix domain-containing protein [Levilactobacillus suantsaii]|uniref:helix-turn-helix domain-containing protein n=1 Tax=Levilactobacillus suantsaii TaxID=2292255 RepID=UPI0015F725E3|nr:helix-turn-helix domain-containing protein [Levilactobacillus suantsaii]QMU08467.1 hypothetical protein H3M12_01980 [Levilactobacillus suantsaii]
MGKIFALHNVGPSNQAISWQLGVCHQTINNELKRGQVRQMKKFNGKHQFSIQYVSEFARC